MNKFRIYKAYLNNKLMAVGTEPIITKKLRLIKSHNFEYYAQKNYTCCGYRFEDTGIDMKPKIESKPTTPKKLSHHDKWLNHLVEYLDKYGNTSIKDDPKLYVDELKQNGYEINYYKSSNDKKFYIVEAI